MYDADINQIKNDVPNAQLVSNMGVAASKANICVYETKSESY